MTLLQVYEGVLIEMSKVGAPSLLLEEFNYYVNKTVYQYINKRYNVYDINQQTTDDLRVLKATALFNDKNGALKKAYSDSIDTRSESYLSLAHPSLTSLHGTAYEVYLPLDYLHVLNCVCIYKLNKSYRCYDEGDYVQFPANRLTADTATSILTNCYLKPAPQRPYYYIHNVNTKDSYPYNPVYPTTGLGTDMVGIYGVVPSTDDSNTGEGGYSLDSNLGSNFPRTISLEGGTNISTVERATAYRYGNASPVRMEIRYGKDDSVFQLVEVQVDYIKTPQTLRLTQGQTDLAGEDTSQILEFPDYVCQEIINELVLLLMEKNRDPRVSTHSQVTQSIANPAQVQPSQKA